MEPTVIVFFAGFCIGIVVGILVVMHGCECD